MSINFNINFHKFIFKGGRCAFNDMVNPGIKKLCEKIEREVFQYDLHYRQAIKRSEEGIDIDLDRDLTILVIENKGKHTNRITEIRNGKDLSKKLETAGFTKEQILKVMTLANQRFTTLCIEQAVNKMGNTIMEIDSQSLICLPDAKKTSGDENFTITIDMDQWGNLILSASIINTLTFLKPEDNLEEKEPDIVFRGEVSYDLSKDQFNFANDVSKIPSVSLPSKVSKRETIPKVVKKPRSLFSRIFGI